MAANVPNNPGSPALAPPAAINFMDRLETASKLVLLTHLDRMSWQCRQMDKIGYRYMQIIIIIIGRKVLLYAILLHVILPKGSRLVDPGPPQHPFLGMVEHHRVVDETYSAANIASGISCVGVHKMMTYLHHHHDISPSPS